MKSAGNKKMLRKIQLKHFIVAHTVLLVLSFAFLEYSKLFRMSEDKHWIYTYGHMWWIFVALPTAFLGSMILGIYSLWKVKNYKFIYFLTSLIPAILFVILFII